MAVGPRIRLRAARLAAWAVALSACLHATAGATDTFSLLLRSRDRESGHLRQLPVEWKAAETALIVCDMWDSHHSRNAALRTAEVAPRIDALAREARARGALVIHAPSGCMVAYDGHPARLRAVEAPAAPSVPEGIEAWCHWKDETEESTGYPIDHSDGGEDDEPEALAAWHRELEAQGRNPGSPWQRQIASIAIDPEADAISDSGVEIWNLLEARGIRNVMIAGVHTNMCVLGRPFGLRQMARNGKNTVLVRDLTDTMYNPKMRPFVGHFVGTDLVVAHIEQHVCPTIGSRQVLGGTSFRFADDRRRTAVALVAEHEYDTASTLPRFLEATLRDAFRLDYAFADPDDPNRLPGIESTDEADLLVVSVRRRTPPLDQLELVRRHVANGRAVVGIRTASHAFALRGDDAPPAGHGTWPGFDPDVLGGNYQGHHGNELKTEAWIPDSVPADHPIVAGVRNAGPWPTGGSLYRNAPLRAGTEVILMGRAASIDQAEPVAWTHRSPGGGRVFYTSLGHKADFERPEFIRLLDNACRWAVGLPPGGGSEPD